MPAPNGQKHPSSDCEERKGQWRGTLAASLDRLTDALVLVAQHGIYCHSDRDPGRPALDIEMVTGELQKARELIRGVMVSLEPRRSTARAPQAARGPELHHS